MRKSSSSIHVHTGSHIFVEAQRYVIGLLKAYMDRGESVLLFLSGGSVVRVYEAIGYWLLAVGKKRKDLHSLLVFAQVDERFRPKKLSVARLPARQVGNQLSVAEEINAHAIEKTRLWRVCDGLGIPCHSISQEGTLVSSTKRYAKQISQLMKQYKKKIGIFGVGEDGHTAGLLPGHQREWDPDTRKIRPVRTAFARGPLAKTVGTGRDKDFGLVVGYRNNGTFSQRITLTPKAIRMLDGAIVVAVGENKKKALESIMNPANKMDINTCPGAILQDIPHVDLFTDQSVVSNE